MSGEGAVVNNSDSFPSVTVTQEAATSPSSARAQARESEKEQQQPSTGMEFDSRSHGDSGYIASITVGICAMNKKVVCTGSTKSVDFFSPRNFQLLYPIM